MLLHHCYQHLERPHSFSFSFFFFFCFFLFFFFFILYIDFSSAFNTIQPHIMAKKLFGYDVDHHLVLWIFEFLINRTQCVRFQSSSSLNTATGAPQGTVLAPVLFTLYTNDCMGTNITPFIKYSDNIALMDFSDDDTTYFNKVSRFTVWCKETNLDLNVSKTKEMVIDFHKNGVCFPDLEIEGVKVERVNEYKYLGTVMDNKFNCIANTLFLYKKCQSCIFFCFKN